MRIVAGEFKGRQLAGPRTRVTRPTSERVREALFSIVGEFQGLRVLDLFAGTGALGIEALSRGAEHVTFVERHAPTLGLLTKNLRTVFGGDIPPARAEVVRADVVKQLVRLDGPYDLVFIDPPYADADRLAPVLRAELPRLLSPNARVIAESGKRMPLRLEDAGADTFAAAQEPHQPALQLELERRYGDTLLRVFRAAPAGADAD